MRLIWSIVCVPARSCLQQGHVDTVVETLRSQQYMSVLLLGPVRRLSCTPVSWCTTVCDIALDMQAVVHTSSPLILHTSPWPDLRCLSIS